jgi:hypothetical protein
VIRTRKAGFIAAAGLAACLLLPGHAAAQYRGRVVVGAGFYRPFYYRPYYYRPFFYPYVYSPFYFGFGAFYDGFYSAWYPYGPYPYYPYPGYYSGGWSSARIEVKPREAQVYLDGYYVGIVDQFDGVFQRLDIPPGEHELTVYLPGYHTMRERTFFRPGHGYHFKEALQPLPPGAPPEPKPQPEPRPAAPGGPEPYRGGDPNAPGPYRQPAAPPQGRPLPPPGRGGERGAEFGTLNLRVQPPDAVVVIDGERWDSPEGGSRLVVQLPAGPHRIEVRRDGFRTYTQTIQIRAGEQQTLNVSLPQSFILNPSSFLLNP